MAAGATANRIVVDHLAVGVDAASSRTRVLALVVETGLGQETFRADNAFGSARRRATDIVWLARADRHLVHHSAQAVRSAG